MILIGRESYCHFSTIQAGINYLEQKPDSAKKKMVILSGSIRKL
ncbi:hypothetical protein [Bacillus sp. SD088]|nr:hypothetical protein [Bacillus sp. SD088]